MPRWLVPDYETVSACDLKKAGAWRYAEDPTTEILCLAYEFDDGRANVWYPGQPMPEDWGQAIADGFLFCPHNAAFEKAHYLRHNVERWGWPPIPAAQWHDSMAVCAMRAIPQSLDRATAIMRLGELKDNEGSRLTIGLSRVNKKTGMMPAITPEVLARVGAYCVQDVVAQKGLHKRMGWLPPGERQVWLLDQEINERGIRLDMDFVRAAQSVVDQASRPLLAEYRAITGYTLTQAAKSLDWVRARGVDIPNMQKETLAKLLGEADGVEDEDGSDHAGDEDGPTHRVDLPAEVRRALHIRQLIGSASIKKLEAMQSCVCSDGRARGTLQYHGAGPGRWAGRLLQPQNFPRGSLAKGSVPEDVVAAIMTRDPEYVRMLYAEPVETVVSSLRYAIVASPGCELVAGDYAGIEARIVLALAGQHDKTALMASGVDVYCDMASDIYGRPITKADLVERQMGKNSVLGLGFQMGKWKFHDRYCVDQPVEFAERVVTTYRQEWAPLVPKLWYALERASVQAVHTGRPHEAYGVEYQVEDIWLTARLPSGRKLWYAYPEPFRKAMPWDPTDIRPAFRYKAWKYGQWRTVEAFGGLMTENVVQALARDLMVASMRRMGENGFPVILTVHDEIVGEPLARHADAQAFKQIMEDAPEWIRDIRVPVAVETWTGSRYKK